MLPALRRASFIFASFLLALSGCSTPAPAPAPQPEPPKAVSVDDGLARIQNVIVIYAENRSFDNLYGLFPGANGVANASTESTTQVDRDGTPLAKLPPVWGSGNTPDPAYPADLPNKPFRIDAPPINLPLATATRDLWHLFYQNQDQINEGRNNRFVEAGDSGALVMGYYNGSSMAMWKIAKEFTLADNFFMGAFGGSYLNHMWLACACTPVFPTAPVSTVAKLDGNGRLQRMSSTPASALNGPPQYGASGVTPDGYSINTTQPPYQPSNLPPIAGGDPRYADPGRHPLPPQTAKTLGDTLSAKGVSWAWYAGAWNDALADGTQAPDAKRVVIYNRAKGSPNFQTHHQPYNYFANYAPGTQAREMHLRDGAEFLAAIDNGTLPQVAFYKPQGNLNQHPGYADVLAGDEHIAAIVNRIRASKLWPNTAIIVTYDENGGFWDHVAPPRGDRWGPGSRIPAIIISPFAKRGFVDHTQYDTTSIHKFIARRFKLELLPGVRASMGDLTSAFDFSR
jgi:acid phosphatase